MTGRTSLRLAGGFTLLLAVAFGLFALQLNMWLKPVDTPVLSQEPILVSIPSGSSSIRIAGILKENGLIRHAQVFRYYAKYRGLDSKLKAGNYIFTYGMSINELLQELTAGNVYRPTVRVTIPEGFSLEQIAMRLAQNGLVDYDEFMDLAAGTIPASGQQTAGQRYTLEGYLYPDTYEFDTNISAEAILQRMQGRLEQVLTPELRQRTEELGLSIHELITMASLVEREVQAPEERDIVAGVLHNRLKKEKPLELCASVIYALGEHRNELLLTDLEVDSPYNTYKNSGLPPGPIASPGKDSILAVLYPAETDYLYYVLKDDGTGTHYFGRTFAEHQANIRKARKNR
jgi:UPF0755 protein